MTIWKTRDGDPRQFNYDDLYTQWEQVLTFVVGGEGKRMNERLAALPHHPDFHLFAAGDKPHVFLPNGSRIFEVDDEVVDALEKAVASDAVDNALVRFGLSAPAYIEDGPPISFATRALSLAVSQKCNLGCTYCYADGEYLEKNPATCLWMLPSKPSTVSCGSRNKVSITPLPSGRRATRQSRCPASRRYTCPGMEQPAASSVSFSITTSSARW